MRLYEDTHTEFKTVSDGDRFEAVRSLNQQLTFHSASKEFQNRNLPFGEAQQRSLHLLTPEGLYTNLALLLSDQCPFTIRAARFSGTDKYTFQDRAEFEGSIFTQLEAAYAYLEKHNQLGSRFNGLHRIDRKDYPADALREALLNAAIHRDYSFSSSILLSIFDDRVEIVSMGGLMPGLTQNDIMLGVSVQRNEALATIFYRLQLVEAFGTGLPRINHAYKESPSKPQVQVSENAFKITLPNQNFVSQTVNQDFNVSSVTKDFLEISEPTANYQVTQQPAQYQKIIQDYLVQNKTLTRLQAETLLDVSQATAARILSRMTEQGILQREGRGRETYYQLV